MQRLIIFFFLSFTLYSNAQDFETEFEKSNGIRTATYQQTIQFYKNLANNYPEISIQEIGMTDSGKPLHLVIFNRNSEAKTTKNTILINNGIHPGEPDGIDASMMMLRDIVKNKNLNEQFSNITICIIPIYNVGGSLNRNSYSRVNQNGPESYGFRGNTRNFDLNRDFIKNDTKNSKAFSKIFHLVDPDIFIDNHVSNGADYQYTLTHLFTQHNKLGDELGIFLNEKMMPEIEKDLNKNNLIITPYVNVFNRVPDSGFSQFFDNPRYSTGYTTLFNTLGLMVETHMLKPYKQRVKATYELMFSALVFLNKNGKEITILRDQANNKLPSYKTYPIQWEIDSTQTSILQFKGYNGSFVKSEVTGLKRLKYNRNKPFTKSVKYYNHFKSKKSIVIPKAYIIPQGWWKIIERLELNQIQFQTLKKDTLLFVEAYQIDKYKTTGRPYEGHYNHYNTEITKVNIQQQFKKGDLYIPTDQKGFRYLIETLEPEAPDSFFNWNFFDSILQKKEGFSPYVFEDLALEILNKNQQLKTDLEKLKVKDKDFANNWYAQLNYIYKHSKYTEKAFMQYPVYRIVK